MGEFDLVIGFAEPVAVGDDVDDSSRRSLSRCRGRIIRNLDDRVRDPFAPGVALKGTPSRERAGG